MLDDTILVIDADHETEEKIVSTLEAEGYLVFTASGRDVSSGMAEKINPALIYLKPSANSVEGFEVCKKIHNMETYRNVPIVLLASLKGPLDSRYTTFYGVAAYLKMPPGSEELLEMTRNILGSRSSDLEGPEEGRGAMEDESRPAGERPFSEDLKITPEEESAAEEEMAMANGPAVVDDEFADISEVGQPNEDYSYEDSKEEIINGGLFKRGRRRSHKQNSLIGPAVVGVAVIAVLAAAYLVYRFFISTPEVKMPVAVVAPKAAEQQIPQTLPTPEQQEKELPVAEAKTAKTNELPKEAPVQKTAPAPAAVSKPAAKIFYSVQLGAFKSQSGADALMKTYKTKGYEVFTRKGTSDRGTFYRVLIGEFENRKEALSLAVQIQGKEKIKTIIFSDGTN